MTKVIEIHPEGNTSVQNVMANIPANVAILHFRVDISDTLMYVYEMLGAELLSNLYDRLGRQLMDPQQSAVWQVMSLITDY